MLMIKFELKYLISVKRENVHHNVSAVILSVYSSGRRGAVKLLIDSGIAHSQMELFYFHVYAFIQAYA